MVPTDVVDAPYGRTPIGNCKMERLRKIAYSRVFGLFTLLTGYHTAKAIGRDPSAAAMTQSVSAAQASRAGGSFSGDIPLLQHVVLTEKPFILPGQICIGDGR